MEKFHKFIFALILIQISFGTNAQFVEQFKKMGTVTNTYEKICANKSHSFRNIKSQWTNICNVVVKSDLCKKIKDSEKINCKDSSENELNVQSLEFIKNCGVGFFYESLKEFVTFIYELVVGVGSYVIDGKKRGEINAALKEYWGSIKNYIAIEYAKDFDKTKNKAKSYKNVAFNLTSLIFKKMAQAISDSYYQLGCYTRELRQEKICKTVGSFVMPPVVALGLVFKGPALLKKVSTSLSKGDDSSPGAPKLTMVGRNDPVLRKEALKVSDEELQSPEFKELTADLTHLMERNGGVGVAAPQAGVSKRIVVVRSSTEGNKVLINPTINPISSAKKTSLEGCLSIKGKCGLVQRNKDIEVRYTNERGESVVWNPKGKDAITVQHKADHLDGTLWFHRQRKFTKQFGIHPIAALSDSKSIEFNKYLESLSLEEKAKLKELSPSMNQMFLNLQDEKTLIGSLPGMSVDQKFDFANFVYRELLKEQTSRGALDKIEKLVDSDQKALIVYEILKGVKSKQASNVISGLSSLKKFDVVHTFSARGPPYKSALEINVKQTSGSEGKSLKFDSVEEAIKFSKYAARYRIRQDVNSGNFEVKLPDSEKATLVTVSGKDNVLYLIHKFEERNGVEFAKLTSKYLFEGDPKRPITFGIESEMNFVENPNLLLDYKIIGYDQNAWNDLPLKERLEAAKTARLKVDPKTPFLEKLPGRNEKLPKIIINEGDGNVELNGLVFHNLDEVKDFVKYIDNRYGKSSLQGHVVRDNKSELQGISGFTVFESDHAQIRSLDRHFELHSKDNTFVPGKNLSHHSLGPLSDKDLALYKKSEAHVGMGKKSDVDSSSSRIVYAPVLRTEPYPKGKVGVELRQYHKRSDELLRGMQDLASDMSKENGLANYFQFSKIELINDKLPQARAKELGVNLSRKWKGGFFSDDTFFKETGKKIRSEFPNLMYGGADPEQRFFYPLRDWTNYPSVKMLPAKEQAEAVRKINEATRDYLIVLDKKVTNFNGRSVTPNDIKEMQIAASIWAKKSGLKEILDGHAHSLKNKDVSAKPAYIIDVKTTDKRTSPEGSAELFEKSIKSFPNGKSYEEIVLKKDIPETLPRYQEFLEETVEVIYSPTGPFGHINLRVGERVYSFNDVQSVSINQFKAMKKDGRVGYAFEVSSEKIAKLKHDLERFYSDSRDFNVPPFDAYSPKVDVKAVDNGTVQFKSSSPNYGNNKKAAADIVDDGNDAYLESPSGMKYPLERKNDGTYCTQSFSCATSATHLLKKSFGIDVEFEQGAKSLKELLEAGNPKGTSPDFKIVY